MTGYAYNEEEPVENCPYCGTECYADFVDVGVGYQQCGPYFCYCGASEIGPCDDERPLSQKEKETGWYAPDSEPGSSANVINGVIVDHKTMELVYRANYPHSAEDGWRDDIRRKD